MIDESAVIDSKLAFIDSNQTKIHSFKWLFLTLKVHQKFSKQTKNAKKGANIGKKGLKRYNKRAFSSSDVARAVTLTIITYNV